MPPFRRDVANWDKAQVLQFVKDSLGDILDDEDLAKVTDLKAHGRLFVDRPGLESWAALGKVSGGVCYELGKLSASLRDDDEAAPAKSGLPIPIPSSEPSQLLTARNAKEGTGTPEVSLLPSSSQRSSSVVETSPEPEYRDRVRNLISRIKEQAKTEKWTIESFSDPKNHFEIPYPVVDPDESRFNLNRKIKFHFIGRTAFKNIYDDMWSERLTRRYHGTEGYGKSYILAGIVSLLLVNGLRVVYVPDCGELASNDPVRRLRRTLYTSFHDRPHRQTMVAELKTEKDIIRFCVQYRGKLVFIFDHYDAIEDSGLSTSVTEIGQERKRQLRELLDDISYGYRRVFCSSGNHLTSRLKQEAMKNDVYVDLCGGFNEVEQKWWWIHQSKIYDTVSELDSKVRKRINVVTGGVPLYMARAIQCLPEEWIIGLRQSYRDVITFSSDMKLWYGKDQPQVLDKYYTNLEIAVRGSQCHRPEVRCLDHRYFYYDPKIKRIVPIAELVTSAAQWILNQRSLHLLAVPDYLMMIENMKGNPSMIGFAAEGAVISEVHVNGMRQVDSKLKTVVAVSFETETPTYQLDTEGTRMYIPDRFNYPAIDFLLVHRTGMIQKKQPREATVIPVQVTLNYTGHSNSEKAFFRRWADWKMQFVQEGIKVVEIIFVWVTPRRSTKKSIKKDSLGFVHPAYTRQLISFQAINKDLDRALQAVDAYPDQKHLKASPSSSPPSSANNSPTRSASQAPGTAPAGLTTAPGGQTRGGAVRKRQASAAQKTSSGPGKRAKKT